MVRWWNRKSTTNLRKAVHACTKKRQRIAAIRRSTCLKRHDYGKSHCSLWSFGWQYHWHSMGMYEMLVHWVWMSLLHSRLQPPPKCQLTFYSHSHWTSLVAGGMHSVHWCWVEYSACCQPCSRSASIRHWWPSSVDFGSIFRTILAYSMLPKCCLRWSVLKALHSSI